MVPTLVAHTVLNNQIHWDTFPWIISSDHDSWNYHKWLKESFKKCVVKVNKKEWQKIIQITNVFLGHENTTLGGEKSCAIPPIMEEYPNVIKFAKLWTP